MDTLTLLLIVGGGGFLLYKYKDKLFNTKPKTPEDLRKDQMKRELEMQRLQQQLIIEKEKAEILKMKGQVQRTQQTNKVNFNPPTQVSQFANTFKGFEIEELTQIRIVKSGNGAVCKAKKKDIGKYGFLIIEGKKK